MREWAGDNPYYLVIVTKDESDMVIIDLDVTGWVAEHAVLMRVPAHWHLIHKEDERQPLVIDVHEAEQPYYTARHVGMAGSSGSNEVVAYGIGKKKYDGTMVRLWQMPDGRVVGGDDVDSYGISLVKALGPRGIHEE